MALQNDYKFMKAFELVKAGLDSGSIKLIGTGGSLHSTTNGEADAKYLKALLETLAQALPASD